MERIIDFTDGGKCSNCGQCCSDFLPLSSEEVKRLKKYIKEHGIQEQRHNFLNGVDVTCPFRDEANRKCTVYEVRPAICRQFMCNHTEEDIRKAKFDFHRINKVVAMRSEFFGSTEDSDFLSGLFKLVLGGSQP